MIIGSHRLHFGDMIAACALLCLLLADSSSGQTGMPMNQSTGTIRFVPDAVPIPPTYFGMHIHNAATTTPWPAVPFGTWRLWDAHVAWPDLEPKQGKWVFDKLDTYLNMAQQHHVQVLLTLAMSPTWTSARPQEHSAFQPGFASEPRQMSDWDDYVRAVVTHCKGRVYAYEVWNEPNLHDYWSGRTDQILTMTRDAHDIIKSIDPSALVVSPSATASNRGDFWLSDFLDQGGGKYVDVIGFHFYSESPETMAQMVALIRQKLKDHHLDSLQLWNTEAGWAKPKPFPSAELGAAFLARAYLLAWAAGVQRFYWYAWDNHTFVSIETTTPDSQAMTLAGKAYATVQSWIVGAKMTACEMTADHTWTCTLQRGSDSFWVIWNTDQQKTLQLPAAWHAMAATSLIGGSIPIQKGTVPVTAIPELITSGKAISEKGTPPGNPTHDYRGTSAGGAH